MADPRRLLVATAGFVLVATAFVAFLVFQTSRTERPREYRPFEVRLGPALTERIDERPVFFADPTGGDRGFVLTTHEGRLLALHVIPPGGTAACPVDWDPEAEQLVDCEGTAYEPDQLARFPVTAGPGADGADEDAVLIDLRTIEPAPAPRLGIRST